MKILITGGAGYTGSVLVPELLRQGHQVTVLDNFLYGQTSLLDCCFFENFTLIKGDARDKRILKESMKDADFILPLACLTGAPICQQNPEEAKAINHDAIKHILEIRSKSQKIIFPNTNSGYGIGQEGIFCTEKTPLNPVSLYGKLKVDIEKMILDAGESITLRLATVFGPSPRMRLDLLVNDFVYRAYFDRSIILFESSFKRNYLHINDVAGAYIHCIENFEEMKDQTYNVGLNDANLSKKELCQKIQNHLPHFKYIESEIGEDPDKRNYIVSNEKINKSGFTAKTDLDSGIKQLLKSFQIIKENRFSNV